jgi:hypothetical protein
MARERSVCLAGGLVALCAVGALGQVQTFINDFDGWGEAFGGTERRVEGVRGCGRSRPALPTGMYCVFFFQMSRAKSKFFGFFLTLGPEV